MNLRIGQKIVCISDAPHYRYGKVPLVKGCIYTIRAFSDGYEDGRIGIHVVGIACILRPDGSERGFNPDRFRPVVDRNTDISVFTKILDDVRSKQPAL